MEVHAPSAGFPYGPERGPRLLGGFEPFVGEQLAQEFADGGIDVRTERTATRVDHSGGSGPVTLTLDDDHAVTADELLVAAGRVPRTHDIGLEFVGLQPGQWITVDDTCRVTDVGGGWLYAAGDVNKRAMLTHMGKYQARACGDAIAARASGQTVDARPWSRFTATADHGCVPQVVFTDPQVG